MSIASAPSDVAAQPPRLDYIVTDATRHTMDRDVFPYVEKKIHQLIKSQPWSRIEVRGAYIRPPGAVAADSEKSDKQFNWHRPTATQLDSETLALNCFPSVSYTEHYAGLVATYLSLTGKDASVVCCQPPTPEDCAAIFAQSNLRDMGKADLVVVGYVYQLSRFLGDEWEGYSSGNLFAWQKKTLPSGLVIGYVECMVSLWGDSAGNLIRALQEYSDIKCVIYLGKAGSLRPEDEPNEWIVSGGRSHIGEEITTWDNVLAPELEGADKVIIGDIVTVPSPLCESFEWLRQWQPSCSWVDCEVGHMALASRSGGTQFGYLHIISDNVAGGHGENLANEDAQSIRLKRRVLFQKVEDILEAFFSRYGSEVKKSSEGCP